MKTAFGVLLILVGFLIIAFGRRSLANAGSLARTIEFSKSQTTVITWVSGAITIMFGIALLLRQ